MRNSEVKNIREKIAAMKASGHRFGQAQPLPKELQEWIHLLPIGHWDEFRGMGPGWGEEMDITAEHIGQMVAHFASWNRPALVDYEHNHFWGDTRASGWILEVQARADGLWGRVEWTETAAGEIQRREFRYVSPVWDLDFKDTQTGDRIGAVFFGAGLTNDPFFLRELEQRLAAKETTMDELKKIAAALGLAETATLDEILTAITALKEKLANASGEPAAAKTKKLGELVAATEARIKTLAQPNPILETVRNELMLPSAAKSEEYVAAIQARGQGESALAAKVATLEGEVAAAKAERLVEAAMAEGKVVAATRAWATEFAKKDSTGFSTWAASAPRVMPMNPTKPGTPQAGDGPVEPTEKEKEVAARTKQDPKALADRRAKREGVA
ncbi:MAG: phage protease [bacterium]|nr:phage protease [bacterium]